MNAPRFCTTSLEARCYLVHIKQDTDSKILPGEFSLWWWFTLYFQVFWNYQLIVLCSGPEGGSPHCWSGPPLAKVIVCSASLLGFPLEQGDICLTQHPTCQTSSTSLAYLPEVCSCSVSMCFLAAPHHSLSISCVVPGPNFTVISHLVNTEGSRLHDGAGHHRARITQHCWSRMVAGIFCSLFKSWRVLRNTCAAQW